MGGTTAVPTAILQLRGSWRAGARAAGEPRGEPVAKPIAPPGWLPKRAKAAWRRLVPRLMAQGCLAQADREPLARYCHMLDVWRTLADWLTEHAKETCYEVHDKLGQVSGVKAWPQVAQYQVMSNQLRGLEREFGMTPSARAAIGEAVHNVGVEKRRAQKETRATAEQSQERGKDRFFGA